MNDHVRAPLHGSVKTHLTANGLDAKLAEALNQPRKTEMVKDLNIAREAMHEEVRELIERGNLSNETCYILADLAVAGMGFEEEGDRLARLLDAAYPRAKDFAGSTAAERVWQGWGPDWQPKWLTGWTQPSKRGAAPAEGADVVLEAGTEVRFCIPFTDIDLELTLPAPATLREIAGLMADRYSEAVFEPMRLVLASEREQNRSVSLYAHPVSDRITKTRRPERRAF